MQWKKLQSWTMLLCGTYQSRGLKDGWTGWEHLYTIMRVMYQVAEDDFRVKRDGKKMKEISTPRIKDTQWREHQQDIATRLAADAQTTTYETQQGKMGAEEGRKEVLSRRQGAAVLPASATVVVGGRRRR